MVDHGDESPPRGSQTAAATRLPVIFNPDFFVEKLRHENADVFLELVLSNITRLIDLPGAEFSQLLGEEGPKTPGFFRSFNFLKRKGWWPTKCFGYLLLQLMKCDVGNTHTSREESTVGSRTGYFE